MSPLPVSLVAFQAQATRGGVALLWATASEHNAGQFVLERAADAPIGFAAIGQVPCTGTTSHNQAHQFVDPNPAARSFYRLRQVDRDGTVTFSPVVAKNGPSRPLHCEHSLAPPLGLCVWPGQWVRSLAFLTT